MPFVRLFYFVGIFHLESKFDSNTSSIILRLSFRVKVIFYFITLILQFIKEIQEIFFKFVMDSGYLQFYFLVLLVKFINLVFPRCLISKKFN